MMEQRSTIAQAVQENIQCFYFLELLEQEDPTLLLNYKVH